MAIEHSDAFQALEKFSAAFERQPINFPVVQDDVGTVFARPLTCGEFDKLAQYKGHEYNVRLCMAALEKEDGKPVFRPEDFAGLYSAGRGTAMIFAQAAGQIVAAQKVDFDALKK